MTGGEAIVRALRAQGVDTVFGIPGVQTYALFDALARTPEIRVLTPRHEQTCAYMAFGYARSTGRTGVYTVVPGPGVLNSSAALCSAYGASEPVVLVTSEVPSPAIGSGLGHLHELPDQLGTLRTLTKWAAQIDRPADAPGLVAEAFRQATSGRPRPVAVQMPWDALEVDEETPEPQAATPDPPPRADGAALERAAELLAAARKPMLMVGGGATRAVEEVRALAGLLQAPVVPFRSGRGIVPDDDPLGFTCASGAALWDATDVVVGIGSRLELLWFRWKPRRPDQTLVLIDVDSEQPQRLNADVPLVGDAAETVRALLELLRGQERASRAEELVAVKERMDAEFRSVTPYAQLLAAIREALPRDGFVVEEVCQAGFTSYFALPVYEPRTFVSCGHQGTLGFGFPTALGVKAGNPRRAVVSLTGDGGFQFGLQELATAAQERLGLVTVLFDNDAYGNVLRDQETRYGGRVLGSRLDNPDFAALARAYGVNAWTARTPAELRGAVADAIDADAPGLVWVQVDRADEVSPWPFLMPRGYGR